MIFLDLFSDKTPLAFKFSKNLSFLLPGSVFKPLSDVNLGSFRLELTVPLTDPLARVRGRVCVNESVLDLRWCSDGDTDSSLFLTPLDVAAWYKDWSLACDE